MSGRGQRSIRTTVASVVALAMLVASATSSAAQDVALLSGDGTTEPSQAESVGDDLKTVVDVEAERFDGFDRVTFTYAGDGQPGWFVLYEDEPMSDGSGLPIDVDGDVGLRVVLTGIALPPDATAVTFEDDVAGPDGGIVNEVVNDGIFEGHHTFVIGLDDEVPYRIGVVDDPSRVVVELVHDVPAGGVATGQGGGLTQNGWVFALSAVGLVLLGAAALTWRRRIG
ncbi:AMIN-like domain-containing (lipo)protein [Salsipaludibacter albus]|uniref:AMIN-like domain-containing (lipo)protein n=1 Tax=Salsipaludibacter albus TaxID=2849650 RepID=UPI001EE3CEC8|nr:hypothetical protein [Salsipaludibacter albus]MBY5163719.1 hypothetical protein [Salsipaludibacter albus]